MSVEERLKEIEEELEGKGFNPKGTKDIFGRKFPLPVDAEHKATVFGIGIIARGPVQPHLRAFWAATLGFFSCFFSVFAPAAMMPYLKMSAAEGGIALDKFTGATAGSVAVASTIIMRMICGAMCDVMGARKTFVILLMLAVPGILLLIFALNENTKWMLILARGLIGLGLASFVTCQVWCSQMFTKSVVGIANATAGGWGNLGGGVTQLVMPQIMLAVLSATNDDVRTSWRICFVVPLIMHLISAVAVISGRDLPDGNFKALEAAGAKKKASAGGVAKIGLSNVNAWVMFITYGLCFGIELTMNNKVVPFFYRYYAVNPQTAGVLGSCFGLMNLFARSWGGMLSDAMNKRFGMRGRLWAMWVVQTIEGFMCICMGLVTIGYPSPDDAATDGMKVPGTWVTTVYRQDTTYTFNSSIGMVDVCGSKNLKTPNAGWINFATNPTSTVVPTEDKYIMIKDPNPLCIHNAAPLGVTMVVMVMFSLCVQAAEGLHFGVVPYISRPALGIVSGMVGAGGNFGGVMGSKYIVGPYARLDQGFIYLGIIIMIGSLSMFGIYFPEHGGMLFKAGGLGGYDPQMIKPPADMVGADQLDYSKAKEAKAES